MIKSIVFDFDGVIVRNSETSKQEAWMKMFPPDMEKDVLDAVKKYEGGKGTRFEILNEITRVLDIPEAEIEKWVKNKADEFGELTSNAAVDEGVLPDDLSALKILSEKYPLYLNSATPEPALLGIVDRLGIRNLFKAVYGQRNSNSKRENLKRATDDSGALAKNILFVGDALTDFEAAKDYGCLFVGVANDWNKWGREKKQFPIIVNIQDLLDYCQ